MTPSWSQRHWMLVQWLWFIAAIVAIGLPFLLVVWFLNRAMSCGCPP